jgi:Hsp20/alpha crystallin family
MTWKDLIPWSGDRSAPDMSSSLHGKDDAPLALHQQMNRLLDNVTRNFSSGLTIKGKKEEEKNGGNALSSKRKRRQFRRWLRLRSDVEPNKVNTSFRNGVLTVTLAKRAQP